jgi:hypothetical protein
VAYCVQFTKAKVEQFLQDIAANRPLAPPDGGWNRYNMPAVAGGLDYATLTRGPLPYWITDPREKRRVPREHWEASKQTLEKDLECAFGFYRDVTRLVAEDKYDQEFPPVYRVLVYMDADGAVQVVPQV